MRTPLFLLTAAAVLVSTSACSSGVRQALGVEKTTPDEFRVMTIAPLSVPPEYNLVPPEPGGLRPEDIFPDQQARRAIFGDLEATTATDAEILLAARAGAGNANPNVRALIDGETAQVVRKDRSFADRILFWREDSAGTEVQVTAEAEPIDPELERQRIEAVTGGQPVDIPQPRTVRSKLPGL
ncbi:DUF3035 domain-containing protein [Marinicauda algicola]|uniref:DUF3035 domain-containing protein n=1 Tax=Marinicauda algicola TaxID=2029849 RepID=A0A4S2GZM5_9PROT|nr:DUF3035 domain-containing protein [Marinicauda algicola]TGY88458.1 DUF3035 domain-containing protein [Marinicauda algicola]